MNDINDYAAKLSIPFEILASGNAQDYIQSRIQQMEKDAIYQAVKQVPADQEGWICIKPTLKEEKNPPFGIDYKIVIHCRPVEYSRVYIPIYEAKSMPKDVFLCSWCGGYTKNDKRGHCAGCGGPRNENYLANNL